MLVFGAEDRLEQRTIETGLSNWEYTEVINGLGEGDRVVLSLERPGVMAGAKAVPEQRTGALGKR